MTSKITRRYGIGDGASVGSAQSQATADGGAIAAIQGLELQPNRGIPLNLDWVEEVRVNTSAVERRAQTLVTRRTVKKEWQMAWLLRAISCMDLTTLSGDDTDERVRRLCAKARQPIQHEHCEKLGIEELNIEGGAVCVYHTFVETALRALEGSGIQGGCGFHGISGGTFPAGGTRGGNPPLRGGGSARNRRGDHAGACVWREMAGALRRSRDVQGRVRTGAHEGDSGHGRFDDACAMWRAPAWWP